MSLEVCRERGEEVSRCLRGRQERCVGPCSEKYRGLGIVILVLRRRFRGIVGRVPEHLWDRVLYSSFLLNAVAIGFRRRVLTRR
jgi:hypothetical protein